MKYQLLKGDTLTIHNGNGKSVTLHRIIATRDIFEHNIKEGTIGGYIERSSNLDQEDGSWVGDSAKVYGANSFITGNSLITGSATVINSTIEENCSIRDRSYVSNVQASACNFSDNCKLVGSTLKSITAHNNTVSGNSAIYTPKQLDIRNSVVANISYIHCVGKVDGCILRDASKIVSKNEMPILVENCTLSEYATITKSAENQILATEGFVALSSGDTNVKNPK